MKTTAIEIPFNGKLIHCYVDEGNPVVWVDNHLYTGLKLLIDAYPDLQESGYLVALAKVTNFLSRGFEFKVITDIPAFCTTYETRLVEEEREPNLTPTHLSAYGNFDVSVITSPKIERGKFRFFVENDYNHLPYKVTMEFPPNIASPDIHYTLLPYASD